jgi:hypothetical protein
MPIEFRCTQCQQLLRTPDETAGQEARCPQCSAITPVPAESISELARDFPNPPVPRRSPRDEPANPYAASPDAGAEYRHMMVETLPTGLAVASMVVGIVGLLLSLVCGCFMVVSGPLDLIAVVLGIVALQQINRGEAGGRGMAIAGIICGSVGLALSLLILLFFGFASMMGQIK